MGFGFGSFRQPSNSANHLTDRDVRGVKTTWTLLVLRFMGAYSDILLAGCVCIGSGNNRYGPYVWWLFVRRSTVGS